MPRKPRVVIPGNPGELIKLTGQVYAKHKDLGIKSPLAVLESPTWDELGLNVDKVLATQGKIDDLEKQLKVLYGERDPYLEQFTDLNRRSRDLLLALYAANPAKLGDYGFDVIEAVAPGTGGIKPGK